MPPRHQTLPPAQTASAREAQKSFFCELCNKGYTRMNDYEAHLGSYDHAHKQRNKDVKSMLRDAGASARARKAEAKDTALLSVKLDDGVSSASGSAAGGSAGFKKGGFKKSGFKSTFAPAASQQTAGHPQGNLETAATGPDATDSQRPSVLKGHYYESDTEDEGYEVYDPKYPTD